MWIIFERAKGTDSLINSAIAWLTQGPYCHCELVFEGEVCFSSAAAYGGTAFHPFTDENQYDVYPIPTTEAEEARIKLWCTGELGCGYDYTGTLAFILPLKPTKHRWFCSEVCISAMQQIGMFKDLIPYKTSPNAFADAVKGFQEGVHWAKRPVVSSPDV